MAVQNQDLRRFAGQLRREGLQQLLVGEGILGGVSDVDLPADGIATFVNCQIPGKSIFSLSQVNLNSDFVPFLICP